MKVKFLFSFLLLLQIIFSALSYTVTITKQEYNTVKTAINKHTPQNTNYLYFNKTLYRSGLLLSTHAGELFRLNDENSVADFIAALDSFSTDVGNSLGILDVFLKRSSPQETITFNMVSYLIPMVTKYDLNDLPWLQPVVQNLQLREMLM